MTLTFKVVSQVLVHLLHVWFFGIPLQLGARPFLYGQYLLVMSSLQVNLLI